MGNALANHRPAMLRYCHMDTVGAEMREDARNEACTA